MSDPRKSGLIWAKGKLVETQENSSAERQYRCRNGERNSVQIGEWGVRQTPEEGGGLLGSMASGLPRGSWCQWAPTGFQVKAGSETHPTKAKFLTDLMYKPLLGDVGRRDRPQVKLPRPKAWVAGLNTAVPKSQHCMHKQRWRQEGQGTKEKQKMQTAIKELASL